MNERDFKELIIKCYRLPWKEEDNPNGWIEPTTFCQLKCPGCYRGLDKINPKYVHEYLDKMKRQIDYFIKYRNIQTLSVAGGEPLLYPKIKRIIELCPEQRIENLDLYQWFGS